MLKTSRRFASLLIQNRGLSRASFASASSYPSHEVVGVPALSPTMTHGNLAKWNLAAGDAITAGDVICEIETDKAVVDFEAQDDMFLAKILIPEGTPDVPVGAPMMITVEEEEDVAAFADYTVDESAADTPEPVRSEEATPPTKSEVPTDAATSQPVVPVDFLVNAQTVHETAAPAPASSPVTSSFATSPVSSTTTSTTTNNVVKKASASSSPLLESLRKDRQAYVDLYGHTSSVAV